MTRALVLALSLLCALPLPSRADDVRPLRHDLRVELPLLGLGAVAWLTSEVLKPKLAPRACRVCGKNRLDYAVQQGARWQNYEGARRTSDVLLFGLVPGLTFGGALALGLRHGTTRDALVNALVLGEAMVLTSGLTQLTKFLVGRERPYVRTQRDEARDFVASPDDHLSFFSGHTSMTFTLAVSLATTATLRGYREAPYAWAFGLPLAALTGYLRIAADRHYLTDVLTGALIGSAVGVLVPFLHRSREREPSRAGSPAEAPAMTLTLAY